MADEKKPQKKTSVGDAAGKAVQRTLGPFGDWLSGKNALDLNVMGHTGPATQRQAQMENLPTQAMAPLALPADNMSDGPFSGMGLGTPPEAAAPPVATDPQSAAQVPAQAAGPAAAPAPAEAPAPAPEAPPAEAGPTSNMQMLPSQAGGGAATDRTRSIYAWDDPDMNFSDYARNTFSQSLEDVGGVLSPDSTQNPFAESPYARWFMGQYGQSAPMQALLQMGLPGSPMAGAGPEDGVFSATMENAQKDFIGGPRPFIGTGQANQNMDALGAQLSARRGSTDPAMTGQDALLDEINGDPYLAAQMIMAQLQDTVGGIRGGRHTQRRLMDAAKNYNMPTAEGMQEQQAGPFFNSVRRRIGS